jgi:putative protein-disulfide isomerase
MTQILIYVADPMCSWCWGFSPVMDQVLSRFGERLPVRLIVGGLRPGTVDPMDDAMRTSIRDHWNHVHEASGQPFDFAFFDRERFVYDTEPACRAVVATRKIAPSNAMLMLKRAHRAFYAENTDVTDRAVQCDLAVEIGLERADFEAAFDDEDTLAETRNDFAIAHQSGITGFPTLIVGSDEEGYTAVSRGFQPADRILALIDAWLAQQDAVAV